MNTQIVCSTALAVILLSAAAHAQPAIFANGIVNAASSTPVGLPGSSVAQGSIFSIYGQNLGPAASPPLSWPLKAEEGLGGVTVKIQPDNGPAVYAILLYVGPGQINAVLPSTVPPGHATAQVTYNGASSDAAGFTVIKSSAGLLAWNQQGSGPGIVQNYHTATPAFNNITDSAIPGDVAVAWGTGLGPVSFDEKNPPVQGDLGAGAELWVGGVKANVLYQGRSTAAGQDQINFVVPNVPGCYVPVYVKVDGAISNTVTMAIAPQGGMCQDSSLGGLDPAYVRANGLRFGSVNLVRTTTSGVTAAAAGARFYRYDWNRLMRTHDGLGVSVPGACTTVAFNNAGTAGGDEPIIPDYLDAGASLTLNGPDGAAKTLAPIDAGRYSVQLAADYFAPGDFRVSGPGGANVGAFAAGASVPQPLVWTNAGDFTAALRTVPLPIIWTGGQGKVFIQGYSSTDTPQKVAAAFVCLADASKGSFTVPAAILSALPASVMQDGVFTGSLVVGELLDPVPFAAVGLDVATVNVSSSTSKNVRFE